MPTLDKHQSTATTKLLLIGDSGAGKSGAVVSLIQAGYNVRFLDLDNGIDIVANILRQTSPALLEAVQFITLTEKMRSVGGKAVPVSASVWKRLLETLDNWRDPELGPDGKQLSDPAEPGKPAKLRWVGELGPITSWGTNDVLVIDSLTFAAKAAMNYALSLNGRLGQQAHQSDWYVAQELLEGLLQLLYDENVKCNVVVNCHVVYIGEENGPQKGYPASLGKALSPKIGRYFNSCLLVQSSGVGANAKRLIHTQPQGFIELKTSNPLKVAKTYPIETGLAEYFKAVRA